MIDRRIRMIDLVNHHAVLKSEFQVAFNRVLSSGHYIGGPEVQHFERNLADYLGAKHVISCGNGTDALQLALMALDLQVNDQIIVPSFGYASLIEVIILLGLQPVYVDIDPTTFNIDANKIEEYITPKTKAIAPIHLFGGMADMETINDLAYQYNLTVIEDVAQALGSEINYSDRDPKMAGTIGEIGCFSFFPTKNLGALGDGGAICTSDDQLSQKMRSLGRHGQSKKYHHESVGINSRLDPLQAAFLDIKLKRLNQQIAKKREIASKYTQQLITVSEIITPHQEVSHSYHQYAILLQEGKRRELVIHLDQQGIDTKVYYPIPLYKQNAYRALAPAELFHAVTESVCQNILSLPIHTSMSDEMIDHVCSSIKAYFS